MCDEYEMFELIEEDSETAHSALVLRRQLRNLSDPFATLDDIQFIKRYRLTKQLVLELCDELRPFLSVPSKSTDLSVEIKVSA